jgi:D-arabinose 1-dehydrogenase-like Zn-dependent alcohol dehydrogenase
MKPQHLQSTVHEIDFDELPQAFTTLLEGKARGRYVVKLD